MPRLSSVLLPLACLQVALATVSAEPARPVDTLQFGLLALGMTQDEVHVRLGPPAHVATATRTVLVPLRTPYAGRRQAPAYGVRTTEVEWWYYPEGRGSMATVLEFHDGELYAKDKYR